MKRKREEIGFHRQKRSKVDVIHPEIGTKEYKSIELRNGLTVLVISDPFIRGRSGSLAAAAMSVRVGSLSDPKEIPGLSHFFEHMVFTGTKQFPGENEFKAFVQMHGGDANAFTEMDFSQFYMKVKPDHFEGALERFSQLFIAPLVNIESMVREIHAIDSEFESDKQEDEYRLEQLKCHTFPKNHPLNRFACGNKKTFLNDTLTMETLRHRTLKLFNEYYYGDSMKLTLIGQESISVLESWVRKYFSGVKTGTPRTTFPKFNSINHLSKSFVLYGLQAVEDHHIFEVSWMIPPKSDNFYLEKPENYLVELLGHEVKGSLYALFKDKGWATSLVAKVGGSGCSCTVFGRMFIISVYLTNSGLEKKYEMVSYIYQYLKLLRGMRPEQWVMKEYLKIKKMEFDSLDFDGMAAVNSLKFAKYLSANMLDFPVRHAVSGEYLNQTWNPKAIEDLLKHFTPQSMRLDLVSNSIKAREFKIEPWFNSLYIEEQVPLVFKEEWNNISDVDKALHLPAKNKFIPSSFQPIDHSLDDVSTKILVDDPHMKIYHKCDGGLAHAFFNIYLNDESADVKNLLLRALFTKLLEDDLSETMFQGSSAGLTTSLSLCDTKVVLKTHGYYEKLGLLISDIVEKFMNFFPTMERFEVIKESMNRELKNNDFDLLVHSEQLLVQMISRSSHSNRSKLEGLNTISFSDLRSFISDLRSKLFIEGICFGGISESEAMRICNVFQRLETSSLPMNLRDKERILHIPCAKQRLDVKVKNKLECNSLAKVYFRIGCENQVPREMAMLNLFVSIISAKFSHKLRTKKKLGYVVNCGSHVLCGVGLYACVISSNYSPSRLSREIYKFMKHIGSWLVSLRKQRFEAYKKGVIAKLPDDSGKSIWEQIVRESCIIDFYAEQKKELGLITKEELIAWYKKYFRRSSPSCRTVTVCIWGCNTDLAHAKVLRLRKKMKVQKQRWFFTKMRHGGKVLSKKK